MVLISQPFLALGTPNNRNKFDRTLNLEISEIELHLINSNQNILIFLKRIIKFKNLKKLAAHLEEAHSTLHVTTTHYGTPVEKHCLNLQYELYEFVDIKQQINFKVTYNLTC